MDGETIYDVDDRTQDHQGYIGSVTNVKPSKIDNKEEMEFIDKTKIIIR